jgi:hypothetical protein
METIRIPFDQIQRVKNSPHMTLYNASEHGIEIARWCRSRGLELHRDFDWTVNHDERSIIISFYGDAAKFASMVLLMYGN